MRLDGGSKVIGGVLYGPEDAEAGQYGGAHKQRAGRWAQQRALPCERGRHSTTDRQGTAETEQRPLGKALVGLGGDTEAVFIRSSAASSVAAPITPSADGPPVPPGDISIAMPPVAIALDTTNAKGIS